MSNKGKNKKDRLSNKDKLRYRENTKDWLSSKKEKKLSVNLNYNKKCKDKLMNRLAWSNNVILNRKKQDLQNKSAKDKKS